MTISQQILADLVFGTSSTSYIAERTGLPESGITATLKEEEIAGTVTSRSLKGVITVWQLTDEGRAIAETFPKAPLIFD